MHSLNSDHHACNHHPTNLRRTVIPSSYRSRAHLPHPSVPPFHTTCHPIFSRLTPTSHPAGNPAESRRERSYRPASRLQDAILCFRCMLQWKAWCMVRERASVWRGRASPSVVPCQFLSRVAGLRMHAGGRMLVAVPVSGHQVLR